MNCCAIYCNGSSFCALLLTNWKLFCEFFDVETLRVDYSGTLEEKVKIVLKANKIYLRIFLKRNIFSFRILGNPKTLRISDNKISVSALVKTEVVKSFLFKK